MTVGWLTVTRAPKFVVKAPFFCDKQSWGGHMLTPTRQRLLLLPFRSMCTQRNDCSTKLAPTLFIVHGFHQLASWDTARTKFVGSLHGKMDDNGCVLKHDTGIERFFICRKFGFGCCSANAVQFVVFFKLGFGAFLQKSIMLRVATLCRKAQ